MKNLLLYSLVIFFFTSCQHEEITLDTSSEMLAGGETTIFSAGPDAYTFPLANLDDNGISLHLLADGAFGQQFVSAPAIKFGGIGPIFNQNSCESCHTRNGRGKIPESQDDLSTSLIIRLSMPGLGTKGEALPVPGFGTQLQTKAIFGTQPEGKISKTDVETIINYADGLSVSLSKPLYSISVPYQPVPELTLISPRIAQPVFGLGLLEAISETDLFQLADETDQNGDGISGKPNMVWDVLKNQTSLGRFGWKAEQPTAEQQAAGAAHQDMGLTSYYFPLEHCLEQENCQNGLQENLDLEKETIELFTYYFQTLAVPAQRNTDDPKVIKGKSLFSQANCVGCHVPKHVTGVHPIKALSFQTIFPYTDLLLHDMGEELADQRPIFKADGQEWRTPPLWGIGLTQVVNPKATFLHDGRAKTLEEAILWHGGEAESAKETFRTWKKEDREALIAFLKSL